MKLGLGIRTALICDVCSTVNRSAAMICKACARKLPAFYSQDPANAHPAAASPPLKKKRSMPGVVASALVSLGAVAVLLLTTQAPKDASAPPARVATLSAPAILPAPATLTPTASVVPAALPAISSVKALSLPAIDPEVRTLEASLGAATASGTDSMAGRSSDEPKPAKFVKAPSAQTTQGRSASPRFNDSSVRSALAECDGLNFLSNAICMNRKCADQRIGRSAQCVEPLRQRRLDEARRNPTLVG